MFTPAELDRYRKVNCEGEPYLDYEQYWQDKESNETLEIIRKGINNEIQATRNKVELEKLMRKVFRGIKRWN